MVTLRFPSEEALRVVITSGVIDPEIATSAATGWRDDDGTIFIEPEAQLSKSALKKLEAAGVESAESKAPKRARRVSSWAELVALARVHDAEAERVLFVATSARAMLDTAAELLRLGCDRQELRRAGDAYLLRAVAPPYYTLSRAVDHVGGLRAFVPAGNEVWIEYGYAHPLAKLLKAQDGILLIAADGWSRVPSGDWVDLHTIVDLEVPEEKGQHEPTEVPRLRIALRLERGRQGDAPALWVIREDPIRALEALVASFPEEIAQGLLFAVSSGDPPIAIVRTRPTLKKGAVLDIPGEPYRQHAQIPNLFLPLGWALEPPLRAETVRGVVAPDPTRLVWLSGSPPRAETIDEDALRPLADFVEYVVDKATDLGAWMQSATFELAPFEIADADFGAPRSKRGKEPRERTPVEKTTEAPSRPEVRLRAAPLPKDEAPISIVPSSAPASRAPLLEALARKEREFIALTSPADDPEREPLWVEMGELHAALDRRRDVGLCFTRALWDSAKPEAIAKAWARAEAPGQKIGDFLGLRSPSRDDVRAVAALLASGVAADSATVTPWLDAHDEALDLRSLWLARVALSKLSGGDALGLARARDRILRKLHQGLSLERDVPTFLRFLGGERDPAHLRKIASRLDALSKSFEKTKRKTSTVEADPKLTLAYVLYVLAYGFARLGQQEKTTSHLERAQSLLPAKDPVHAYLSAAYGARIQHAVEGLPLHTLLPTEVTKRLDAVTMENRFKIDRVRQYSRILEPHLVTAATSGDDAESSDFNPFTIYIDQGADPRGPEFQAMRTLEGPDLEAAVADIFTGAKKKPPEERARLFDGVMDFFPALRAELARDRLAEITTSLDGIAPVRRTRLLEEALMLAAHIGDDKLIKDTLEKLRAELGRLDVAGAAKVAPAMANALRTLRRVGLKDQASDLLTVLEHASEGTSVKARVARCFTAGALAHIGRFDLAKPIFDAVQKALAGDMPVPERLDLTRAFARAVSSAPQDYATAALDKLPDKLGVISDSFMTNSHLCISVVAFIEAIVLGYASDDLGMGDLGRQWLDDDEYLLRRRIHRDMT